MDDEPGYQKIREARAFLMSEKLGKDDQYSPGLKAHLNDARRYFRRSPLAEQMKEILRAD